ncbi:hypothetical protein ACFMB7_33050 (plasmid) [Bacillus toyonensis]
MIVSSVMVRSKSKAGVIMVMFAGIGGFICISIVYLLPGVLGVCVAMEPTRTISVSGHCLCIKINLPVFCENYILRRFSNQKPLIFYSS